MRLIHLDNTTKKKKINSDMDVLQCFWKRYLNRALTQLEGFLSASGDRGTFMVAEKSWSPRKPTVECVPKYKDAQNRCKT